jgi:hypothetical protein
MHPAGDAGPSLTEEQVGLIFFFVSVSYCILIIMFDSIGRRKLAVSKNLLRHLLDGLTLATGVTVGLALFYHNIFGLVASNFMYVTVTSATCTLGPLINLADRYGWLIET